MRPFARSASSRVPVQRGAMRPRPRPRRAASAPLLLLLSTLLLAAALARAQFNAISGQIPMSYIVELDPELATLDTFRALAASRPPSTASSGAGGAGAGQQPGTAGSKGASSSGSSSGSGSGRGPGLTPAAPPSNTTSVSGSAASIGAGPIVNQPVPVPFGNADATWSPNVTQDLQLAEGPSAAPLQYVSGSGSGSGVEDPASTPSSGEHALQTREEQAAHSRRWWGLRRLLDRRAGAAHHLARRAAAQAPSFYFSIRQEFPNEQLFFGLSVALERASDVVLLAQMRGVKSVTPITFVRRPQPYANRVQLASKPSVRQVSEQYSSLSACGVDKVHAMGFDGAGIKIAVIDTGVDYTHPALGGCFGPSCKVAFGFDFVGDNYDGSNDPVPDSDPLSQCGPHGTHVSGIIGAQDKRYHITGVAPGASLGMYRVFGCTGGTADDVLMKAMETAYDDGADIISISIGAPSGWTESPTAKVASQIAKKGRVVSVAAGNDGNAGMFFPSTPAVGDGVIAVGSVDNAYYTVFNATVSGSNLPQIPYFSSRPLLIPSMSVYATSPDTSVPSDACDPLPDYTPDLSNAIVLTKRGGCSLEQKFRNIAAYNGRYVIIYNTNIAPIYIEPASGILKSAMISAENGQWLVDQLQQGLAVRMAFPDSTALTVANTFTGGIVSSFSSYGPTFDMSSQTDLVAPGGSILGLWPVPLGNFSIVSGTSMAAPYLAGAAALLMQASRAGNTNLSESIIERLRSTAMPVFNATTSARGVLETVAKQGAGLLQVGNAIAYSTHVFPSFLSLNDSTNFAKTQWFTLVNNADQQLTYSLAHEPAGTALTFPKNTAYPYPGPVPLVNAHAAVQISPMMLTVDPGESQMIQVTFTPPSGSSPDPSSFPVFSGFIKVASAPLNESLTVAYLGLAAKLSSLKVLDTGTGVTKGYPLPAIIVGSTGKVQRLPRPYTFANGDIPVMQFRLVGGSRQMIVEVVEAATQTVVDVLPVGDSGSSSGLGAAGVARRAAELGMLGSGSSAGESGAGVFGLEIDALGRQNTALDLGAEYTPMQVRQVLTPPSLRPAGSVGQVAASSLLPRNTLDPDYGIYAVAWDGTVSGVGKVRPGDYQLHLKALKLGADPSQAANSSGSGSASGRNSSASAATAPSTQTGSDASSPWEEWFSPIIRVE